jgi:hypothetical protein
MGRVGVWDGMDGRPQANQSTLDLLTKGISFSCLVINPTHHHRLFGPRRASTSTVIKALWPQGDDIPPAALRRDAARLHLEQSHVLALGFREEARRAPPRAGPGLVRSDNDGRQREELEEGILTTVASYLAMLRVPSFFRPPIRASRDRWANGSRGDSSRFSSGVPYPPGLPSLYHLARDLGYHRRRW